MIKELLEKKERYAHAVGPAIRSKRQELGMTMQELAEQCNLSGAFISLVERGKSNLSLVSLQSISEALGVDIDYFVDIPDGEGLVKRADSPEYIDLDSPVRYVVLSSQFPNQQMEQLLLEVPAGYQFPSVKRSGEGFIYVLSGEITIVIGGDESCLKKGDSVHFDYQMGVSTKNTASEETKVLWCGSPAWLHKDLTK